MNKEFAELAQIIWEKLKQEVQKKGLKLSITEGSKAGSSEVTASCRHRREKWRECSKRGGVVMAESVEMVGVDQRTQTEQLGAKE